MSENLAKLYRIQYGTNVTTLLQDKGGKIAPFCLSGAHEGKQASPVDQLAAVEAQKVTGRYQPMPRVDGDTDRPWVFPVDYDLPQLRDRLDAFKVVVDPTSAMVQNGVKAFRRAEDNEVRDAFFADRKTGENGSGTEQFGTALTTAGGQNVAVATGAAAATGLNVAKLKEVNRKFLADEVDEDEEIHMAITATDNDALLNEMQIISSDFNGNGMETPVLQQRVLKKFLGINFHLFNRVQTGTDDAAGTSRALPAWAKSGMYIGRFAEPFFDLDIRKDLRGYPWQLYQLMSLGATRLEKKKVIRVWSR